MSIIVEGREMECAEHYCAMASQYLALGDVGEMWRCIISATDCLLFREDGAEVVWGAGIDDDWDDAAGELEFAAAMLGR